MTNRELSEPFQKYKAAPPIPPANFGECKIPASQEPRNCMHRNCRSVALTVIGRCQLSLRWKHLFGFTGWVELRDEWASTYSPGFGIPAPEETPNFLSRSRACNASLDRGYRCITFRSSETPSFFCPNSISEKPFFNCAAAALFPVGKFCTTSS